MTRTRPPKGPYQMYVFVNLLRRFTKSFCTPVTSPISAVTFIPMPMPKTFAENSEQMGIVLCFGGQGTVSSHMFNSQKNKLRVSNPRTIIYFPFKMPFESFNLPGAGPIFPD